jgi:hypothetical protein
MSNLKNISGPLIDLVFPLAEPLSEEEIETAEQRQRDELKLGRDQITALPKDSVALVGYLDKCLGLLEAEEDRRQGVESRLTTVMGLCSIAGTVVFGGIVAQAAGTAHFQSSFLQWGVALGAFYLTLQLCSAILAAVRGLGRRSYRAETNDVVLPRIGEEQADHLKRRMQWCLETLVANQTQNNGKVTQMAVAHRAMTNFLVGLLVIALLAVGYAVRPNASNDTVEFLRRNHELMEMLRGPQGPPGPIGPQGNPGPPGTNRPTRSQRTSHSRSK